MSNENSLREAPGESGNGGMRPPLEGVRVLDLTQVIAGPFCTMILADLGAEVVKIERPHEGDDSRRVTRYHGRGEQDEDFFYAMNRSKKSVALDLKDPLAREAARALAARAHVAVENFAPGTAARLGMSWDDLRPLNPRLVYCSLSGYGQTGPYSDRPALDPMVQALSGVMSVTGEPDAGPMQMGAPVADSGAGIFCACAILAALRAAERDGQGRYIDLSLLDSMIAMLGPRMGEPLQAGVNPTRYGNENPMRVPAGAYRTADGQHLDLIVQNDRYWAPFCRALEHEEWIEDPRFATMLARVKHRKEVNALISRCIAERTIDEWMERLTAERIPAAPVNSYAQAVVDPQVVHRGLIRTLEHPRSERIRVVGPPWIMTGAQAEPKPPPLLGQHTEEVLGEWLGWGAAEVERLKSGGTT